MMSLVRKSLVWLPVLLISLSFYACKGKEKIVTPKDMPDLNEQVRPFVTTENTRIRTGPGPQFRIIAQIRPDSKVQVVGRDGDWLLIVSKVGNPPGYIEITAVKPATGEEKESTSPPVEGKYETTADTYVRGGPSIGHPVLANIKKGTIINVVGEDQGWLKVESKTGKPPGYVDANLARPVEPPKSSAR
jgi:uncharacterized protein YgiM (DUF1202 family)